MAELTTGKVIALVKALAVTQGSAITASTVSGTTMTASTALIVGTADTNGVRLDLESGELAVREGDDSAAGNIKVSANLGGVNFGGVGAVGFGSTHLKIGSSSGANNAEMRLNIPMTLSASLTSGASYTFSGALPDGAVILGVSARITTTITGPTSVEIGDGTDADRYGIFSTLTSGQTITPADATATPVGWQAAAGDVVLTAVGGNFTAGAVRIVVHYITMTAPTN